MINEANGSTTQITKLIQNEDTVYHPSPVIRNVLVMGREYRYLSQRVPVLLL